MSKIEWTGETWNPVVGCSIESPGCTNCYAMALADPKRLFPKTDFDYDDSWPVDTVGPADDPDGLKLKQWPLPNVWLGTSVERQQEADQRIPHLLATPAAVRFISAEPLLGPVDLTRLFHDHPAHTNALKGEYRGERGWQIETDKLDWVIVGGESGPDARPMNPDWARSLRAQCEDAKTPFFMKQMSGVTKNAMPPIPDDLMVREYPS